MAQSLTYVFEGGELIPSPPGDPQVLVADSFVVIDGEVVGLERHISRFSQSVTTQTRIPPSDLQPFIQASIAAIDRQGEWFPRLECVSIDGEVHLRYIERTCPARLDSAILASTDRDPRAFPTIKGPDLRALGDLRQSVQVFGADEALIVNRDGTVVEGAWSTIVAWSENGDTLDIPPGTMPRLPSVTESIVVDIARAEGVHIRERATTIDELAEREVWVLSALHGIRLARSIVGGPTLETDETRWAHYRNAWWQMRRPLDGAARSLPASRE